MDKIHVISGLFCTLQVFRGVRRRFLRVICGAFAGDLRPIRAGVDP
jgi:hypothetical protein